MSLKIWAGSEFMRCPRLKLVPWTIVAVKSSGAVSPPPRAIASSEPVIRPRSALRRTTLAAIRPRREPDDLDCSGDRVLDPSGVAEEVAVGVAREEVAAPRAEPLLQEEVEDQRGGDDGHRRGGAEQPAHELVLAAPPAADLDERAHPPAPVAAPRGAAPAAGRVPRDARLTMY